MGKFNYKKATQCLVYLAQLEGKIINKTKVLKLIWLADRLHLRKYGRTILDDTYYAMKNGPVASNTRDLLEGETSFGKRTKEELVYLGEYIKTAPSDNYSVLVIKELDNKHLSETDINALNEIYQHFSKLDWSALSDLSHEYPEWRKYESGFKSGEFKRKKIDCLDFFLDTKNSYQYMEVFNQDEEILGMSKEIFEEKEAFKKMYFKALN